MNSFLSTSDNPFTLKAQIYPLLISKAKNKYYLSPKSLSYLAKFFQVWLQMWMQIQIEEIHLQQQG